MYRTLSLVLSILLSCRCYSQTYVNEFGFRTENDAYLAFGQDQYYTNGISITFRHAIKNPVTPGRFIKKTWEAEVGQMMYNAHSGSTITIQL